MLLTNGKPMPPFTTRKQSSLPPEDTIVADRPRICARRDSFVVENLNPPGCGQKSSPGCLSGPETKHNAALWDDCGDVQWSPERIPARSVLPKDRAREDHTSSAAPREGVTPPMSSMGYDTPSAGASPPGIRTSESQTSGESRTCMSGDGDVGRLRGSYWRIWKGWVAGIRASGAQSQSLMTRIFHGKTSSDPGVNVTVMRSERSGEPRQGAWGGRTAVIKLRQHIARRTGRGGIGGGLGEHCCGTGALVQRYCNRLLDDGESAKVSHAYTTASSAKIESTVRPSLSKHANLRGTIFCLSRTLRTSNCLVFQYYRVMLR